MLQPQFSQSVTFLWKVNNLFACLFFLSKCEILDINRAKLDISQRQISQNVKFLGWEHNVRLKIEIEQEPDIIKQ